MYRGEDTTQRPRSSWEDNIRMNLWDIRLGGYGLDASGSG